MFLALPKVDILHDRADMFDKVRSFFKERQVREVDCPIVSAAASVDLHIDLIPCLDASENRRYLHSSPEYGMKRLLADGIGDIYQLSHVFRQGEYGRKHNPEFMMAEWYRCGFTFQQLIEETFDFIRLFLGPLPSSQISYRQAFKQYIGYDHVYASPERLLQTLSDHQIPLYENILDEGKDALLNQIVGNLIEPQLGHEGLLALSYFPSTQAALAQTIQEGDAQVAERFEVYYQGIELCNGYHELAKPAELRRRFEEANTGRLQLGKEALPLDEPFLAALDRLPDCCGVAVGFDRLMMLRHRCSSISEVIPFDWNSS
jgi:elongation factor P--(R)-beta-lysine ligase